MDIKEVQNINFVANRHPWELARVKIIENFVQKVSKQKDFTKISIIDIGCGDLFVLKTIRKHFQFSEFFGVDVALTAENLANLENSLSETNIKVFNNLNNISAKSNNMVIVLLNDVIEHIADDKTFLLHLQKHPSINSDSVFIITVPAFQGLFSSHDLFLEHYRRYTNNQLVTLLKETNFSITSKGYFFASLLLPRLFVLLKEKIFGTKKISNNSGTDLTNWKGSKFVAHFIKNILLLDYFFTSFFLKLKIKIPGLSTFVICKKSV